MFLIAPEYMTPFADYNAPKDTAFSSVAPFTSTADGNSVAAAINEGSWRFRRHDLKHITTILCPHSQQSP